jgi:hypothetical protein
MNATFAMLNLQNFVARGLEQSGRSEKRSSAKSADFGFGAKIRGSGFQHR